MWSVENCTKSTHDVRVQWYVRFFHVSTYANRDTVFSFSRSSQNLDDQSVPINFTVLKNIVVTPTFSLVYGLICAFSDVP